MIIRKLFSLLCECVSCSKDATAAKSQHFKWIQSKLGEKEKFVVACLRPQEKLSNRKFYVLVVQRRQRSPTEKRKQCTSCMSRVMFCLLKPLACHVHKKNGFLNALNCICLNSKFMPVIIWGAIKKIINNRTKFIYVCVNFFFPPSLASGKREIELKKANRSINSWKVSFVSKLFSSPKNYTTK